MGNSQAVARELGLELGRTFIIGGNSGGMSLMAVWSEGDDTMQLVSTYFGAGGLKHMGPLADLVKGGA